MRRQIPLPLGNFDRFNFELYWPGSNRAAVDHLRLVAAGKSADNIYLWGGPATGKSHLLQAACTLAAAAQRQVMYIPLEDTSRLSPDLLQGVDALDLVCLDDIDRAAGKPEWEIAIFNLYNQLQENHMPLIVSARTGPAGIPLTLPDLRSRLAAGVSWHLSSLTETDRLQALKQRATVRGFELPDEVVDYLSKRVARDMHSLFDWLDRLDHASLAQQKKLTVPFVRELLNTIDIQA